MLSRKLLIAVFIGLALAIVGAIGFYFLALALDTQGLTFWAITTALGKYTNSTVRLPPQVAMPLNPVAFMLFGAGLGFFIPITVAFASNYKEEKVEKSKQ